MRVGASIKDPDDTLDYDVDFGRFLPASDSVQSASVSVDDEALAVDSVQIEGSVVTAWLSGGVSGNSYRVTVTATSAQGRIKDACITLRVRSC